MTQHFTSHPGSDWAMVADGVTIIRADCLDVLSTMPADWVGAVVTDPPYGQTNEKYDRGVDPRVWAELSRVSADGSPLVSFAGSPTYHRIATGIEAGGWKVRQMWAWVYRDGLITSAYPREGFDRLAPAMDPICYATKGKVLLSVGREPGPTWVRKRNTPRSTALSYSGRSGDCRAESATGRYPRTIVSDGVLPFEFFVLPRAGRYAKTGHPNEKPLPLMEWIVSKVPRGRTIIDPFMGSGTTGEACVRLGYRFIGIERDPTYCEMALERLSAAAAKSETDMYARCPA